jgi:membrane fusion protein, multidrug efflux system
MAQETRTTSLVDEPKQSPPPPQDRSRMRWLIVAIVVVLVVAGIFVWRYLDTYESTDDAQVDGHLDQISARVSGYVTKINVDDNQYVKKGAVLVEIDPRDYQVAVDRAKAELADAEATAQAAGLNVPVTSAGTTSQLSSSEADVQSAQAGIDAAQHQVEAAQSKVQEAEANNTRAQADFGRYGELVAKDEVSRQVYDSADATAKADAAAVDEAHHALATAEQQVKEAQSRLAQATAAVDSSRTGPQQVAAMQAHARSAEAIVEQKRSALEQAELNLQYCSVAAPADGVVRKNVELGMNVQAGQPLLSIAELDDVWITANFKETQLTRMKPGQRVTLSADAYSHDYSGRVESIAGASGARFSLLPPENATGNYVKVVQRVPVKIVLDPGQNSDHSLRMGMSVEPKVWLQ